MASQNGGYWSRSWALLTRDKGWIKPILVLAAAQIVPIVGLWGAGGYVLEWARLTAWGVDAAPKQSNVDVGTCIRSGARAFFVVLGYGFCLLLFNMLVYNVLNDFSATLVTSVVSIFVLVLCKVAAIRATIYQRVGSGYQVNRIYDMVKRNFKGFARLTGLMGVTSFVISFVISRTYLAIMFFTLAGIILETIATGNETAAIQTVIGGASPVIPVLLVLSYPAFILVLFQDLMMSTAVGLWMRQFNVPNWGSSADPLPDAPVDSGSYAQTPNQTPPPAAYGLPSQTSDATSSSVPQVQEIEMPTSTYGQQPQTPQPLDQPQAPDQPQPVEQPQEPQGQAPVVQPVPQVLETDESQDKEAPAREQEQQAVETQDVPAAEASGERQEQEAGIGIDALVDSPDMPTVPTFSLEEALHQDDSASSEPYSPPMSGAPVQADADGTVDDATDTDDSLSPADETAQNDEGDDAPADANEITEVIDPSAPREDDEGSPTV